MQGFNTPFNYEVTEGAGVFIFISRQLLNSGAGTLMVTKLMIYAVPCHNETQTRLTKIKRKQLRGQNNNTN